MELGKDQEAITSMLWHTTHTNWFVSFSTVAKTAQFGAQFCANLRLKEKCLSNTYRAIIFLWCNFGHNFSETSYSIRQALRLTKLFCT